jgi:carboxyl-terminal processing protease
MENKKNNMYLIPIVMASCLALGLYLGNVLTPQKSVSLSQDQRNQQKIQDVINVLDKYYVDSVNGEELFNKTLSDMLHNLDPHSGYFSAEDQLAMAESIQGNFGGVGVRFFIIRDTVCIVNVIGNSPSQATGIKAGDKIISVNGKNIASKKISNKDVMGMLKGEKGTSVQVTILRNGNKIKKSIVRGTIPIGTVSVYYMIDKTTGYIKIDQFSATTAAEFRAAATELKSKGLKKVVLDLRNNPGGVLPSSTIISDEFLESGLAIVETRGEHTRTETYRATAEGILEDIEVAVLINGQSASASEILAGAIQDNDRGTIIGRRSFGKGLVQQDFYLRDSSSVRLVVARYYTPTGRCIQRPYSDDYDAYYEDGRDRYDNGELYAVDSTVFVDSLKFITPKGNVVYGGGGIMPDIFVPLDSSGTSWYFTELSYSSAFNTFAFDYIQGKRSKWKSINEFKRSFKVTDAILNQFVEFAWKENKVKKNSKELAYSKSLIKRRLKAEIARQIWDEQGFYQIINTEDPEVKTALKHLH